MHSCHICMFAFGFGRPESHRSIQRSWRQMQLSMSDLDVGAHGSMHVRAGLQHGFCAEQLLGGCLVAGCCRGHRRTLSMQRRSSFLLTRPRLLLAHPRCCFTACLLATRPQLVSSAVPLLLFLAKCQLRIRMEFKSGVSVTGRVPLPLSSWA